MGAEYMCGSMCVPVYVLEICVHIVLQHDLSLFQHVLAMPGLALVSFCSH